ncbi:metalloregulator ArsR/SmtB family transcription factor [Gilvimarinus agarilyticus]|nr:metalloregulator ArsR/SmtB family transcription factor [Gilvimarinus agarilyticus]
MSPVSFYKCLADDTRLHCMLLLQQLGELCVCELVTATGESQPKVSRHLAQLRECGLLQSHRRGKWVYYRLSTALPDWSIAVLKATAEGNEVYLSEAMGRLKQSPSVEIVCCR